MNNRSTEDIFNSLDGIKRAAAPDFFFTRLKARMENGLERPAPSVSWVLKPVYAVAVIALVIVINFAAFFLKNDTGASVTSDSDTLQSIAADYNLADNSSFYELNQENK